MNSKSSDASEFKRDDDDLSSDELVSLKAVMCDGFKFKSSDV